MLRLIFGIIYFLFSIYACYTVYNLQGGMLSYIIAFFFPLVYLPMYLFLIKPLQSKCP